jgi:hypothetical protein
LALRQGRLFLVRLEGSAAVVTSLLDQLIIAFFKKQAKSAEVRRLFIHSLTYICFFIRAKALFSSLET